MVMFSEKLQQTSTRWHQTADFGYTPNPTLENVFMAVAFDTYDEEGGVHSRYLNRRSSSYRVTISLVTTFC